MPYAKMEVSHSIEEHDGAYALVVRYHHSGADSKTNTRIEYTGTKEECERARSMLGLKRIPEGRDIEDVEYDAMKRSNELPGDF